MGKHLENILGKGTAGTGGKADWKRKKTDIVNTGCFFLSVMKMSNSYGFNCFILEGKKTD